MKRPSGLVVVVWVVCAVGIAGLYFGSLSPKLRFAGDAVDFLRLAHSIADGQGYTIEDRFISVWPPVTPLVMGMGIKLFGLDLVGLKVLLMAFGLLGVAAAFVLFRKFYDPSLAGLGILLSAVSFPLIYSLADIGTESIYLFLSMVALLAGQQVLKQNRGIWLPILTGVCIGLAILSRAIGFSLLLGFVLYCIVDFLRVKSVRAGAPIVVLVVALVSAGLWYGYTWTQTSKTPVTAYARVFGQEKYTEQKRPLQVFALAKRAKDNLLGYTFIFSAPDASVRAKQQSRLAPKAMVSAAIMGLAVAGFLWHLLKRPQLPECYLLCYGAVLLVHAWYDIRYITPALPLLFYYMAYATRAIIRAASTTVGMPRLAAPVTAAVLGLLILANLAVSVASPQAKRLRSAEYEGAAREIHQASMWISQQAPNAVIQSRWANMVWYWTRTTVVPVPLLSDHDEMWRYIEEKQVEFIMVDPDDFSGVTPRYLLPAVQAYPERSELVATFGKTKVYRKREPKTGAG